MFFLRMGDVCVVLGRLYPHKTTQCTIKNALHVFFITNGFKMIVSHGFVPNLAPRRGVPVPVLVRYHGYPHVEAPTMTSPQCSVQPRLVKVTLLQVHSSLNKPGSSI